MQRQTTVGLAIAAALLASSAWMLTSARQAFEPVPLLLAPMLELTDSCVLPGNANAQVPATLEAACTEGASASAAALVQHTLAQLPDPQRAGQHQPAYQVGYTMPIPLLQLYTQNARGEWQLQPERIARFVRTIRDTPQQAIVYLFATHFSAHAPIERALAQDASNLAHTQEGPIATSDYLGSPLYAWSVARTDNAITRYRANALKAVVDAICQAGEPTISKVRGLTLLGEVHQLFPGFEASTGYTEPYLISDYSDASIAGFRQFLSRRFSTLHAANRALHSAYSDWEQISPPRDDLSSMPAEQLPHQLHAHLDAYAHGLIPVSGWTYLANAQQHANSRILVFLDGREVARLAIDKGRQDVLEAKPEFGDRTVGWQTMLDYRDWPTGQHRLAIYLQPDAQTPLTLLAEKTLEVRTLRAMASATEWIRPPRTQSLDGLAFHVDLPSPTRIYIHNPLAEQWHAFRRQQVVEYLRYFADLLQGSCLASTPLYTQLYIPSHDPGRDPEKFAVQHATLPQSNVRLALSLYGQAGLDGRFLDELQLAGHKRYGVSEFHPLKGLDGPTLHDVLQMHRRRGADFFSFFLEPVWHGTAVERTANPFSLSPSNPFKGSNVTFEALQTVLQE